MVLTKQSALFNAWKEMNRVSNEYHIPFRCVTQWATHQVGKLHDTLGLTLGSPNGAGQSVEAVFFPLVGPNGPKAVSVRKKAGRGKK
jgi:hypothetical protein